MLPDLNPWYTRLLTRFFEMWFIVYREFHYAWHGAKEDILGIHWGE